MAEIVSSEAGSGDENGRDGDLSPEESKKRDLWERYGIGLAVTLCLIDKLLCPIENSRN